jgi:heptose I phosphotransferase
MFYLDKKLQSSFADNAPLFDQLMTLSGECFRKLEGRTTERVMVGGKSCFIKQHRGVGWREIIKNLLQLRLPVLSAKNEWQALAKLNELGISVPAVLGFGERGWNPAQRESFILMSEVAPVVSLETLCRNWQTSPPSFALKRRLIREVARIARIMHDNGINHRDFYICHFLLDDAQKLFLIDLHRAAIRKKVPLRWRIKDLAGLYFSSMDAGLTRRDLLRFMKDYRNQPLRDILRVEKNLWMKVKQRGDDIYHDHAG